MAKLDKSVQKTLAIVAGVVAVFLIAMIAYSAKSSASTFETTGMASIKALPDKVGIYFNIETKGTTSAEATASNSEIVDKLTTELIRLGFERADIQTTGFNVYPNNEWINNQQINKGYITTHGIKVELPTDDSTKIGSVIDAGVSAGAGISYINFELSQNKQNEYKAQALKAATQDAKTKATAIAEGFGKRLGRLISVKDSSFNYYPGPLYATREGGASDAALAKEAVTNIQPGELEVSAGVITVYKIV
jgi:hypothetical protein